MEQLGDLVSIDGFVFDVFDVIAVGNVAKSVTFKIYFACGLTMLIPSDNIEQATKRREYLISVMKKQLNSKIKEI